MSECQMDISENINKLNLIEGVGIPWPKPQNSIKPENWHENLSQISDVPISEAVRLSHGSSILRCINRSPKEVRRVTQNTMISLPVLDVSMSGQEAYFKIYFGKTCWHVSRWVLIWLKDDLRIVCFEY